MFVTCIKVIYLSELLLTYLVYEISILLKGNFNYYDIDPLGQYY